MDTTLRVLRYGVPRRTTKAHTYVIGLFCGIAFLAAVTVGHASQSCEECVRVEETCIRDGEQRMNDCLDAAEQTAAASCAGLSDEPRYYSHVPATEPGIAPPPQEFPSERQECEEKLLIGERYSEGGGTSVSVTYPWGVEVGIEDGSSNKSSGLYGRCNEKNQPNMYREADCTEERIRCERSCVDAIAGGSFCAGAEKRAKEECGGEPHKFSCSEGFSNTVRYDCGD
jgi:hypothetical protein